MKSILKPIVVSILTFEAKLLISRTKPKIVAVTGSVGKTGAKDAIYHVLKGKVRCRKSEKSYNSEIGVPLSVLGLENAWSNPWLWLKNIIDGLLIALWPGKYPEVLVLEMGVDRPGDMKRLTSWLRPDVVVLTRLPEVPVHVEYFDSPDSVIAEKLTLVSALKNDGVLVYNLDDEKVRQAAAEIRHPSRSYGRYSEADFKVSGDEVIYEHGQPRGLKFQITSATDTADFSLSGAIGEAHFYNFAAAAAVGDVLGLDIRAAAAALQDFAPPPGRMRLIGGLKETVIIDDTYNSSPVALEKALSTLLEIKGFARKVAVLGDMLELGRFSIEAHKKAGQQAAECADMLITVGVRARGLAEGALEAGMSEKHILQYEDTETARREIQNLIEPGDLILVKGSQSRRMEKIVEEIMQNPDEAASLLVRQSRAWKDIV
jgi:UDP-N-acetylmuramoyl-tripeptide--D-alanyl-D-alanine ligase